MTVVDALAVIRRVGTVENDAGNIKLRIPQWAKSEHQVAIARLKSGKVEALAILSCQASEDLAAYEVLKHAGFRIMRIGGEACIGVWRDRDGPRVRAALQVLDGTLPVRHLDDDDIPAYYKERFDCVGTPGPNDRPNEVEATDIG